MTRINERIENFNRAYKIYSDATKAFDKENQLSHMALIQSFEVCFELAWKVLKDYLYLNGLDIRLPKQVIKEAFSTNVIENGQIWIDMLNARNTTSHEYNMDKIDNLLLNMTTSFQKELEIFQKWVNKEITKEAK